MTGNPTLSGSDYFHLLIDRKMLHNGLVGNISRIHLECEKDADLKAIADQLLANETFQTLSQLKVVHRWPLLPKWKIEEGKRKTVELHSSLTRSEFNSTVLNRKVENEKGLVFIDLCVLADGTKHVVISMHHVLFDHQGMVNFLHALADGSKQFPLFPEAAQTSLLKVFANFWYMTVHMLSRSSGQLGTMVHKRLNPRSAPHFKVIGFSEEETKQIEQHAWKSGSRIGQSAFYMAATSRVVNEVLKKRNEKPPYLWFSVPNDQRKKGRAGHLVSNQLSFLFFRLNSTELNTTETAVGSINQQLKAQIKDRITERYSDLLTAMRFLPMSVYEAMVDLASSGKMSSFGFSDLGTDKVRLQEFLGSRIVKLHHYPPVPSPPGFNVVVSKNEGQLKFVWAYFDEVLSPEEIREMEISLRRSLLQGPTAANPYE